MSELDLFGNPVEPNAPRPKGPKNRTGAVRLRTANRCQGEWRHEVLEDVIRPDHAVRRLWDLIGEVDLTPFYDRVGSREAAAGRPAIDPRILLALWVYAATEGIGSARELDRLCTSHDAYRWICGGVQVNYHTLSDFRSSRLEELNYIMCDLLTTLDAAEIISLNEVAIDGTRVRASAGASSFHRARTIDESWTEAEKRVAELVAQREADDGQGSAKQRKAQERAACEQVAKLGAAKAELARMKEEQRTTKPESKRKDPEELRASTTDAEAKVMKMPDGGFRPAYNVQLAGDVDSGMIVGIDVVNTGSDSRQLMHMLDCVREMSGAFPGTVLADGGYVCNDDIQAAMNAGIEVIAPPKKLQEEVKNPERRRKDPGPIARWKEDWAQEKTRERYRKRASTIERINGDLKAHRGLDRFLVRGIKKVKCVTILWAFAYNLRRWSALIAAEGHQAA